MPKKVKTTVSASATFHRLAWATAGNELNRLSQNNRKRRVAVVGKGGTGALGVGRLADDEMVMTERRHYGGAYHSGWRSAPEISTAALRGIASSCRRGGGEMPASVCNLCRARLPCQSCEKSATYQARHLHLAPTA